MPNSLPDPAGQFQEGDRGAAHWHTFADILRRLHCERIYIHPHQLAEFMLLHGLPVALCYVPAHLRQKAQQVNENYQGDLARLEATDEPQQFWFD